MPSNILVNGVDLDTLLLPLGSHTPIANVDIQAIGTDISQRYAPASAGTPYGTTHIITNATGYSNSDIGLLFASIGSTPTVYQINANPGVYSYVGEPTVGSKIFTLTAGFDTIVSGVSLYGFAAGPGIGSINPSNFAGFTITSLQSTVDTNTNQYDDQFSLNVPSNPGSSLFSSLIVNGITRTSSSASYLFSGNTALWSWSGSPTSQALFQHTGTYNVQIS